VSRKLIVNDGKHQRELLLVGTMVVGRDPLCDISEADPLLSRRHVEFVSGSSEVVVRDLGSRNGILINGVKTTQAILRGGDVVQVGHLQVTYVEDSAPIAKSVAPVDPDATALVSPPRTPAPAAPPPPPPPPTSPSELPTMAVPAARTSALPQSPDRARPAPTVDRPAASAPKPSIDDTEKTRFVPPSVAAPPQAAKPAAPPVSRVISTPPAASGDDDPDKTRFVAPPSSPARPARPSPPPPASEDDERTRFIPPPSAPSRPAAAPPPARPKAVEREQPAARPLARTNAPMAVPATERAQPHVAKGSWTFFVLVQVAALAAVVFLATVIPLILWQQRVLNATAASRASALTNWLASNARSALEATNPGAIATAADDISREPGVVSALVLSPEGRVLAPSARSTETIASLPALSLKPGEVSTLRQSWNGDLLESARPVSAGDRSRAAIAWITYRPEQPEEAGSGAVVLALPVIIVLVAAWFSSRLITRKTMGALTALNEDIELAVGGKLEKIGDPLGAKPVTDLADALNYLIVKLRGGASLDALSRSPGALQQPAPLRAAVTPAQAPHHETPAERPARLDARIVVNAQFRVTEASRDCADLIGVRPDALVGQHLIDAIPDRDIADAVMQSLSALGASGEHRTTVAAGSRGYDVSIVVSREGRDKPLTIVLTRNSEVVV
jgi:FHA domain